MQGLVEVEGLGRHIIEEGRLRPGRCANATPNPCEAYASGSTCGRVECCRGTRLWLKPSRAKELCDLKVVMVVPGAENAAAAAVDSKPAQEPAEKKSSSVGGPDGLSTATATSDEPGKETLSLSSPAAPASPPSKSAASKVLDKAKGAIGRSAS